MTYGESIEWLFSTQLFGIKLGLDGPRRLLKEYLAYPPHGMKVIHVCGTNGKGSTCAIMDAVARASGVRVGLFTSPHLIDYRERVRVSGVEIPEEECAEMLGELRVLCERLDPHPTFFEITLALAMRWFRRCECELVILETGMGGRLDATTAVPADVCVVTPIGLDHMQWLGDTVEAIAAEKAGIFLEGVPAVSAGQLPEVERVLEKEANERRTPLRFVRESLEGYALNLEGEHQKRNAALALEALYLCGVGLHYETVKHGLQTVRWAGRFERMEVAGRVVILDGAHNPHGAAVLSATWRQSFGERRAVLLFSAVAAKDVAGMLREVAPLAESIHFCPVDTPRALPVVELRAMLPAGLEVRVAEHATLEEAWQAVREDGSGPVLVAGSLFLIGDFKAMIEGGEFMACTQ